MPLLTGAPLTIRLAVTLGPLAVAAIGFVDDFSGGVSSTVRLLATGVVSSSVAWGVVAGTGTADYWIPLGLIWLTYFTNAYNFMDGIDGISASGAVVMGGAYAWLGRSIESAFLAESALVLAASCLGFAVVNILGRGQFLGDVGSYFFGAGIGTIALALFLDGASAIAVASVVVLYVVDTTVAIVRRFLRGSALNQAHREHTYQRLVDSGLSHATVSALVVLCAGLSSVIGIATDASSPEVRLAALIAIGTLVCSYLASPYLVVALTGGCEGDPAADGGRNGVDLPANMGDAGALGEGR